MQIGFDSPEIQKIIPQVKMLLNSFPGEKVFSNFIDDPHSQFEEQLNWTKFQNKINQKLLKPLNNHKVKQFQHSGYTVLTDELLHFIKSNDFTNIYLCGIYTDVCIIKTAMDIFDQKISVKVIEDACTSLHGVNSHKQAIDSLKHIIGSLNILRVEDIV